MSIARRVKRNWLVHGVLQTRILEWFAISSCCGPCRALHYNPSISGSPPWHAHSFTEYVSPFDMTNTGLLKDFPEMFAKMALNSKHSPNYAALFWHSSDTSDYRSFTRFGYRKRVKE